MWCNYCAIKLTCENEHTAVSDSWKQPNIHKIKELSEEHEWNLSPHSMWWGSKQAEQPSAVKNSQLCLTVPESNMWGSSGPAGTSVAVSWWKMLLSEHCKASFSHSFSTLEGCKFCLLTDCRSLWFIVLWHTCCFLNSVFLWQMSLSAQRFNLCVTPVNTSGVMSQASSLLPCSARTFAVLHRPHLLQP